MTAVQNSEGKVSPLMIIAAIVAVIAVVGALVWNFSRPRELPSSDVASVWRGRGWGAT